MVSGFEIWGHDANLRRHWKNRAFAFIVDTLITFVPISIILYLLDITDILEVGIIVSTVFYLASAIPESLTGATPGKHIFHLKVHGINNGAIAGRVYIRNLSRLFWFFLPPLDFALGMATRGDPRQKMLDIAAGTKVVHKEEREKHEFHLEVLTLNSKPLAKETEAAKDEEKPESEESKKSEDLCHDCGGKMIMLAHDKLQCEKCGLIQ